MAPGTGTRVEAGSASSNVTSSVWFEDGGASSTSAVSLGRPLAAGAPEPVALGLLGDGLLEHLLASPRETGDGVVAETLRGAPEIALVRALLDFAHDALPILLVRVVALDRAFRA